MYELSSEKDSPDNSKVKIYPHLRKNIFFLAQLQMYNLYANLKLKSNSKEKYVFFLIN